MWKLRLSEVKLFDQDTQLVNGRAKTWSQVSLAPKCSYFLPGNNSPLLDGTTRSATYVTQSSCLQPWNNPMCYDFLVSHLQMSPTELKRLAKNTELYL